MKTMEKKTTRHPDRLPNVHPGEILLTEFIEPLSLTQHKVAEATGLPVSRINDLIKRRRGITVDSAIRLGRAFAIAPEFWINLQWLYDKEEAFRSRKKEYDSVRPLKPAVAA